MASCALLSKDDDGCSAPWVPVTDFTSRGSYYGLQALACGSPQTELTVDYFTLMSLDASDHSKRKVALTLGAWHSLLSSWWCLHCADRTCEDFRLPVTLGCEILFIQAFKCRSMGRGVQYCTVWQYRRLSTPGFVFTLSWADVLIHIPALGLL